MQRWLAMLPLLLACVLPVGCTGSPGPWDSYCDGNVLHYSAERSTPSFWADYHWATTDCADNSQVCVRGYDSRISTEVSFCADSAKPDPHCAVPQASRQCDGNTLIGCRAGYVTGKTVCGSKRCVKVDNEYGNTGCIDPASPCFGSLDNWVCDSDTVYLCYNMYETQTGDCTGCSLDKKGFPVSSSGDSCIQ